MSSPIIEVNGISKRYQLGSFGARTLREEAEALLNRFRKPRAGHNGAASKETKSSEFWALRDVSFSLEAGEVLGVIGRNGAGKSTLLKVLSRITEPTDGEAIIRGRVASLLEVGTGFHPELSGRDNIYLNGAILGMKKREIDSKFDEIVAFAEIEKFVDTPVKRYSSGMYVRLAFAVAAHLEPQILVVDEVLAVGDASFQKKCLGKMNAISKTEGRTVIFVSHNGTAIRSLCSKGILLSGGKVTGYGNVEEVMRRYEEDLLAASKLGATNAIAPPKEKRLVWMESVTLSTNGVETASIEMGQPLTLTVKFRAEKPVEAPIVGYLIRSVSGEGLVNANNYFLKSGSYSAPVAEGRVHCDLGVVPFYPGQYSVTLWFCMNPQEQHHVEDAIRFEVTARDLWGTGRMPTQGLSNLWWDTQFRFD